ncbi:MAG: HAD family hydrolase [Hyphomicrobiaceae bacterium]
MIRAIVFDVGETLLDEQGLWHRWADWLDVPRGRLMDTLKDVVRRGAHHRQMFEAFRPGFDLASATDARRAAGDDPGFRIEDFHADARPCLERLRSAGFRVGIAGNTSAATERFLIDAGVAADFISSAASWGTEKPSPAFFARVVEVAAFAPAEIAYVGDRLDNDVLPAMQAGLIGIFLRRGLWAEVHRANPDALRADVTIDALTELPAAFSLRES